MSLMKKYLTHEVIYKYKNKETAFGGTLDQCTMSGVELKESLIGIFATDPDAYESFPELFYPIIREVHRIPACVEDFTHPRVYWGEKDVNDLNLETSDKEGFIISTRVRVARNISGYPLPTTVSKQERLSVESAITEAFDQLPFDLKGNYMKLEEIPEAEREELVANHILYDNKNRFLHSAGVYRDWPSGRGIFRSCSNKLYIWVNEEDQLRIISMAKGARLDLVYKTLTKAVKNLGRNLDFAQHQKLGYITTCPTNLGTTIRASVHMHLPKASHLVNFKEICSEVGLDVRGTYGEHTVSTESVFDLSNRRRLCLTEQDALHQMAAGVRMLLLLEKSL